MPNEPTVADRLRVACVNPERFVQPGFADPTDRRRIARYVQGLLAQSRCYFLDDEATAAASQLGVSHPELLYEMLRKARLPFERVWIEWDVSVQLEAVSSPRLINKGHRTGVFIERLHPTAPQYRMTHVGFVTHEVVPGDLDNFWFGPLCVYYDLEDPTTLPVTVREQLELAEITQNSRMTLRQNLLGAAYVGEVAEQDKLDEKAKRFREEICDRVSRHASWAVHPIMTPIRDALDRGRYRDSYEDVRYHLQVQTQEETGIWRVVLSILALINAREYAVEQVIKPSRRSRLVRGKIVPYVEYRRVGLKLPRKTVIKQIQRKLGESLPRREHKVTGHYAHSHRYGDPNCEHIYVNETETREICCICGAKRWWKNEFTRGDATLGSITKDFMVEKRK